MKRISLDREDEQIKNFIRSLSIDSNGTVLELDGEPFVKVVPIAKKPVDRARLKAAILKRRDPSRKLNEEWQAVDLEMWEKVPPAKE
jgi:hypothetical protein